MYKYLIAYSTSRDVSHIERASYKESSIKNFYVELKAELKSFSDYKKVVEMINESGCGDVAIINVIKLEG